MFEDFVNCQSCEYNPTGEKCELFGRVIGMHGCSSGVERKPRNHFEMVKAMSIEEMAIALCRGGCPPTVWSKDGVLDCPKPEEEVCEEVCGECWLDWLKEEI